MSACPGQLERLKSAVADPAMAAGDLVDLGTLRGHWDMVGESVQLDRLSANAGSLIICADRRPFRWERRRWPDIDLDDFARLWPGDASQRGKHRLFKGLRNVEQNGGPLADYRPAHCRSQAAGGVRATR